LNPEKKVVDFWLNQKGFFTIKNINVAENKEIDFIAIKFGDEGIRKIIHYEVYCSISSPPNLAELKKRFEDKLVVKKINGIIEKFIGKKMGYLKHLVLSNASAKEFADIKIERFEDIFVGFMLGLGRYNYRNDVIRTSQLVKYLLMANPRGMAAIINDSGRNRVMSAPVREGFLNRLTQSDEVRRLIAKQDNIDVLFKILKRSKISAENLAKKLDEEVLTARTRKSFIEALMKQKGIKTLKIGRMQQSLSKFFG